MPLICVVDDNADVRRLLSRTLRRLGHEVEVFAGGSELLDYASRPYNAMPDLVILDYMMPELDGLQTLVWLRLIPWMSHVPVAMFTSCDDDGTLEQRCRDAGAAACWTKARVDLAELEESIAKLLASSAR